MIVEREEYAFSSLMSDIGGVFGLYIGLTFVGFCELLEMIVFIIYYRYLARRSRASHCGQQP